jgi:hypothetical protein
MGLKLILFPFQLPRLLLAHPIDCQLVLQLFIREFKDGLLSADANINQQKIVDRVYFVTNIRFNEIYFYYIP